MAKQSIRVYKNNSNYTLYVNNRVALSSPCEIREAGPGSSNYLIYDIHGNFKIYNVRRCSYVSSRTFTEASGYSDKSKSFAATIRLDSNVGVYTPCLLILDNGYVFEGKNGPEFFKLIRLEYGGIRAVQTFNTDEEKCNWLYLYVSTDKAEFLWKNKTAQRIPLGDIISCQQSNFHAFYCTIADIAYLYADESSEPRKFLYYLKYKSRSKAYDNEITKVTDKRASFNTFTVCKDAPLYFIGEQRLKGNSRMRLFRFNYTDYSDGTETMTNKKSVPTKQMLLPITDLEYYDKIEYKPSVDVFTVCQDSRWFLLKYDKDKEEFIRPLKSISYPSNTFVWINGLMLAIRDDGFYDVYSVNGDSYQCVSLLWREVTYNNSLYRIKYTDINGHECIVPISLIMDKHAESVQNSSYRLSTFKTKIEEPVMSTVPETSPIHYHIDYCTLGRINYHPSDLFLACGKSTKGISVNGEKTFCIICMSTAMMYICKFVRRNTYRVIDKIKLNFDSIQALNFTYGFIKVNKDINKEDLEKEIIRLLNNGGHNSDENKEIFAGTPSDCTVILDDSPKIEAKDKKEIHMDSIATTDIYQKIIVTIDLWKSILPIETLKDFIRPIIQKFYKDIKPEDKDMAALFEKYTYLMDPSKITIDESVMPELDREVAGDTMAHFKIALNYHHKIKHLPFDQAFNISLSDVDCASFIERAIERITEKRNTENKDKVSVLEDVILKRLFKQEVVSIEPDSPKPIDSTTVSPPTTVAGNSGTIKPHRGRFMIRINGKQYSCTLGDVFPSNINERQRRVMKHGNRVMMFVSPSEVTKTQRTMTGIVYSLIGEGKNPRESQIFGSNGNGQIRDSKDDIYLFVEENTGKYRLHDIVRYVDHEEVYEDQRSVIYFKLKSCAKY